MGVQNVVYNRFNYGVTSPLAQAREDINRVAYGAEEQVNIISRTLGVGRFRPGLQYKLATLNNNKARIIPFIYAIDDTALIEFTNNKVRFIIDEQVLTRPSVSTVVTNGGFTSNLSGWTTQDGVGALSYWTNGYLALRGNGANAASIYQQVSVTGGNIGVEHGVRVLVIRGPVTIRIGSSLGADDYVPEVTVAPDGYGAGVYSFSFVPTGDFYIQLSNRETYADSLVDSVIVEFSGTGGQLVLDTPYSEADLPCIRHEQIGDIVYLACASHVQKKILRFGERSWGIENYAPNDGPFGLINVSNIALNTSGLTRQITIASNAPFFKPSMEGSLLKIASAGQEVTEVLGGNNQYTDPVRITGVGGSRRLNISISGSWSGTLTVQRSVAEVGNWVDTGRVFTTNGNFNIQDSDDNAIYFYRIGFNNGYGSGAATVIASTSTGSIEGVVRIVDYISPTSVIGSVLKDLGGGAPTRDWYLGDWSDLKGYPSAVAEHEGRLWWAGKNKIWGSAVDAFESFDEGDDDADAINAQLGSGTLDSINWLSSMMRLVIGTQTQEKTARSTSLDEPLTPSNFNIKTDSTRGSSAVQPVEVDNTAFFVRNTRMYNLIPSDRVDATYQAEDVTILYPEAGISGFTRLAVQRLPDTRIHALRNDGKVALFVFDQLEEVKSWQIIETDGVIEDVVVLPAQADAEEDIVYYVVRRTVNSATVRYLERWALESECEGGTLNKQADSFIAWSGSSNVITGLSHLEGKQVVVWADGKDYSAGFGDDQIKYTVNSGQIILPETVTSAIIGLPYEGRYKSNKLVFAVGQGDAGTSLTQVKRINQLGVILYKTHNKGVVFGRNFTEMDDLPRTLNGEIIGNDVIHERYDHNAIVFDGEYDNDARLCMKMCAPRPATVLGVVATVGMNDKV